MTRFRISSTSIRRALAHTVAASTIASALAACDRAPTESSPPAASATAAPTNRVDINASVRQNLGITFARAEMRGVSRTLRVPGRFELLPTARRDYRAPVEGQVQLLVEQYQPVEAGTPLYRIESPAWRELQREISDAQAQVALAQAAADSVGPFMEAH
jgi:multidrug efflux pump subunit AcrA (membrane-fusion protein)